ncbi:TPA: EF0163 family protein [Enterococcus faecalis]|uniref:EF0163 family protein n=1 Tax=Enterococcus faecalis TaxID=1351 RepID=UPI003983F38F
MNKLPLLILLIGGVLLVSGCQNHKEENKSSKVLAEETTVIGTVEEEQTKESLKSETTKNQTEVTKLQEPNHIKLLEAYGNAYANFTSINDRNEKLKPLMTEDCIKKNGIDVKTGVALVSVGSVTTIYKNDQNEYALLLDCEQNGTQTRVLLLVKVKNNKISEMTYNSVKKEY